MKTIRFVIWTVAAALSLAACNPDDLKDGQYAVTVTAGENGSASADKTTAAPGEKVTITAVPDEGFELSTWVVTSGNAALADATAAETSFTMPEGDVEISVSFREAGAAVDDTEDILPSIKDAAFKQYAELRMGSIEKIENTTYPAWDQNGDGKLTAKEASEVGAISLSAVAADVTTFEDLKYFTGLEILVADNVWAESGYEYLSQLPKLKVFKASSTILGEPGDVLDFSGCPDLNTVVCAGSDLYGIDVSTCSNLLELDISQTGISGELDLSACSSLRTLSIRLTGITKLDVSHCSQLESLDAASVDNLEDLVLPDNSSLTNISVSGSKITSLDMTKHPNVTRLAISKNENLTSLDLSNCPKLVTLYCMYSPIGTLDLSKCPEIVTVYAIQCKLTEVNLTGCSKLYELYLQHNNLRTIDATDCGFYEEDGVSYVYALGAQVEPGTEPYSDQLEGEIKHYAWAGLIDDDGKDWSGIVKPITVEIYLTKAHEEYWNTMASALEENNNSVVTDRYPEGANFGHVNVHFIDN